MSTLSSLALKEAQTEEQEFSLPRVFIDKVGLDKDTVDVSVAVVEESEADLRSSLELVFPEYNQFLCFYIVAAEEGYDFENFDEFGFQKAVVESYVDKDKIKVVKYALSDFAKSKTSIEGDRELEYKVNYLNHKFEISTKEELNVFAFSYFNLREYLSDDIILNEAFIDEDLNFGPLSKLTAVQEKRITSEEAVSSLQVVEDIDKFKIDLTYEEKESNPGIKRLGSQQRVKNTTNPPYTTDLWTSRNPDNSYGFSFVLDAYEVLSQNSFFSGLIDKVVKNGKAKEFFTGNDIIEILNTNVYRKKIKSKDGISFPLTRDNIEQSENSIPELVYQDGKKIIPKVEKGSKYGLSDNYLTFFFKDSEIKNKQAGFYQYFVDITISDPTFKYMKNILSNLSFNLKQVEYYLANCSRAGVDKIQNNRLDSDFGFLNSHVEATLPPITVAEIEGYYDPVLDRFTDSWIQDGSSFYENTVRPAINYYTTISYLFSNFQNRQDAIQDFEKLTSPKTGNPRGILLLISSYKRLIESVSDVIKSIPNKTKDRRGASDPKKEGGRSGNVSRIFRLNIDFSSVLDTRDYSLYGYDFLGASEQNADFDFGDLSSISANTWNSRLESEAEKFSFDEAVSQQFEDMPSGSLTPHSIVGLNSSLNFFKNQAQNINYFDTEFKMVYSKKVRKRNKDSYDYILESELANASADKMEKIFLNLTGFSTSLENKKLFDDVSNEMFEIGKSDTTVIDSVPVFDKTPKAAKQAPFNLDELELLSKIMELESDSVQQNEEQKSLRSYLRLNKENMIQVQYLSGFEVIGDKTFVKSPVWKDLNSIEQINSSFVICRINKVVKNNNYDLPIYNKYFIIRDIDLVQAPVLEEPLAQQPEMEDMPTQELNVIMPVFTGIYN